MTSGVLSLARPAVRDLVAYSSARSLGIEGDLYLDANESPWAPHPEEFASQGVNRYPEPQPGKLRQSLAELYEVSPDSLLIGRGADEAIDTLVRAFVEPGTDRCLICPPTYGMYEVAARLQGAQVVRVPTRKETGFALDVPAVLAAVDSRVKLVFVCTPNNPTGNCIPAATLEEVARALEGRALLVLDEAYIEFADAGTSFASRLEEFPNLVVLRTLSKAWALAGARCGVAMAHPEIIALLQKVRAPYPLSTPAVRTVTAALSVEGRTVCRARVARLCASRDRLAEQLRALPQVVRVFPSEANFLLVETRDARRFLDACLEDGIVVRDRSSDLGLENCVRVSLGTDGENERLLSALRRGGAR